MARSGNGSNQYTEYAVGILTAAPITLAGWIRPESVVGTRAVVTLVNSASAVNRDSFYLMLVGTDVTARTNGTSNSVSATVGTAVVNTWQHVGAVFASATSRVAYHNGTAGTANTTSAVPSGINRTNLFAIRQASDTAFLSGRIAEVGIWNVALSANEMAALSRGLSPLYVRPVNLVAYWPLRGLESAPIDLHPRSADANDYPMTNTGTTAANHAPVAPLSSRLWGMDVVTATPPSITSELTASGTESVAFTYQATADSAVTWSATGLPSGLSIDSGTGLISGYPTQNGVFNVSLTATNSSGQDAETLVITIAQQAAGPSLEYTLPIAKIRYTIPDDDKRK